MNTAHELDIPEFLLVRNRVSTSYTRAMTARHSTEFDWAAYYGPGGVAHRLGYLESDEERAIRVRWLAEQKELKERSLAKFQEKRLDQDDADIKQAVREHQHKIKPKGVRRRRRI